MTPREILTEVETRLIEVYGDLDTELTTAEDITTGTDGLAEVASNISPIKHYPPTNK